MILPNWENRTLFHGDNLKFMQAMNSETVDLIATHPPLNKGKEFTPHPIRWPQARSFKIAGHGKRMYMRNGWIKYRMTTRTLCT